ncbi:MAG: aspartate-semialdehyde dehydrogenase [Dehalococcoidia bacterium]
MTSRGRGYTVAVVGATGAVGREFLRIAESRDFPISSLRLLASSRSAGNRMRFRGEEIEVEETTDRSFRDVDLAFISATTEASRHYCPLAVEAGAVAIDDSSAFRMDPAVPLVVPEVNADDLSRDRRLVAIPNCSTTPLVLALAPLHRANRVTRVVVSTYQSVSGTGTAAMQELTSQTKQVLDGGHPDAEVYPHQIAFNLLPQIDAFLDNGYTKEEWKMVQETRKIMHEPALPVSSTCVRVPVYVCHSEAVHVEFQRPIAPEEVRHLLEGAQGLALDEAGKPESYHYPIQAAGTDPVYVSRIRQDASLRNGIAMWLVSDNLRKGAALNAIQIAESMAERDLI